MSTEIKVPTLGESVTEATVAKWLKQPGDAVAVDDPLVELETDKVTLEVNAPAAGTLGEIRAAEGETVAVGAVLGVVAAGGAGSGPHPNPPPLAGEGVQGAAAVAENPPPQAGPAAAENPPQQAGEGRVGEAAGTASDRAEAALERSGPAARKLAAESGIDAAAVTPTGPGGRITKGDVIAARDRATPALAVAAAPAEKRPVGERESRVRMTRLRRRIAERLKAAQNDAAMLTTFNEIDMSAAMALRERWRDAFEKKHGARLGFMSFFVRAAIVALREWPAVNAEIDGDDIIYKNHYDIGVAVGTEQGLVVPVVRDADRMGFAEIEAAIAALGAKARAGKLTIEDLSGGTFTISNGGVYGSLLSTPILNPPQSAILGMHKIERRPIAVPGPTPGSEQVAIRPMMYVAVSYDHRIVDGREAVGFLVRIKECVEDPSRLLFGL